MKHLYRYCPGVVLSIFMMCVALVGCVPEAIELPCRVRAIVTDSATNISVNEATLNAVVSLIDKDSIDCGVIYGANETLSSAKGTMVATAANGEYAVVVDKLKANTTYYYRAYALDAGMYKYGKVHSFKTDISVATGEATEITDCSAMLGGEVNSSDVQLSCGVIYSTSQENVTSTKDCVMASTTSKGVYAVPVTELKHATIYYYRAYAVMDGAYRYGEVRSFKTTLAVATGEATDVTPTSAKLNGALEGAENRTTCGFYYGTTETLDTESWTKLTTNSDGEFYKDLTDLNANTTYYYCAYAIIGGNYRYGEVCSFKTGVTITTLSASDVTATSATLKGWMNSSEAQLPCGFIYGTSSELTPEVGQRVSTTANGDFTASIANLKDNTTYYYRAYVVVDGEYQYGKVLSFLTGYALTVTTNSASSITHNSVMISGKVTGAGKSVICGVIYSTESTLSSTSGSRVSTTANGSFTVAITGLNANTTYYYRAYAVSNGVYTYGEVSSFKTAANVTVTTGEATNVTGNSVTMNAAVSSSGQLVICGIVYNTTTSLSFGDGVKLSTTSKGAYSFYTANLQPNTTYYYRAYVSIGDTYKYGAIRSFKTLDASAISINKASSITENSATLNGTASGVTESALCGIICGTSSTLTLTNAAASYFGLGNGNFTWTITGLNPNTTYYYCYYILVDGVYKYGEVSSFTTKQEVVDNPSVSYETFTVNGVSFRMIDVEGGTFMMGSSDSDSEAYDEEKPAHQVTLSSYAIGETEVTQELWKAVMGSNPSNYSGEQKPVEGVSWNDCQEFISKLNELTGENFRLPTEAEWEYAARGGNTSQGYKYSGSNTIDNVAWYNGIEGTYIVKTKQPNELGIYDMSGNVGEWCVDWHSSSYYSSSSETNPTGPVSGLGRVIRGGSWYCIARYCRVTYRSYGSTDGGGGDVGLRLVRFDEPLQMVTIATGEVSDITTDGATLSGVVTGADNAISCGIIYGTSSDMSLNSGRGETSSNGAYSISVSDLQPGTTYYYCAYAIIGGTEQCGEVRSFTTNQEEDNAGSVGEAIDLGLSVKWASWNVGADSPEEYGGYFAWGETVTKTDYSSSNSVTYGLSIEELESRGIIDSDGNLTAAYDAATANWGEDWRMPTLDEMKELRYKCIWEWTTMSGEYGYKVTGTNGNFIFLPAAGYSYGTSLFNVGSYGYYWSATPLSGSDGAYYLYSYSDNIDWRYNIRLNGQAVRPVYGTPQSSVTISTGEVTDITADGATLSGVVTGADNAISCGIIYGTSSDMSLNSGRGETSSNGTYSINISDLQPNTTYYYCAYAIIGGTEQYGEVCSFTTEQNIIVTTNEASDITYGGARISGSVSGTDESVVRGFIFGLSPTLSSSDDMRKEIGTSYDFSLFMKTLSPGVTYYYRAYAVIDGEEKYGEIISFTTLQNVVNASYETYTANGVSFKMISVEGGTFMMGSTDSDSNASDDEKPAHQVTLSSYAIGETEVTQELWQAVMGNNPSYYKEGGLQCPVDQVSWNDCQKFISKLNELTGGNFRLPTEAEWEFAARGGNASNGYMYSGSNTIYDVAWYIYTTSYETMPVKTKQSNELGIYDMSGNVEEWCSDWYGDYTSSAVTNPVGPSSGTERVYRGGTGGDYESDCRVANRKSANFIKSTFLGFRLVSSDVPLQEVTIATGEVTDITADGATLSGVVTGADEAISCGIIYGTSSTMSSLNNKRIGTESDGTYSMSVSYLQSGTTYYYCAYAVIDGEEWFGEVRSFTTEQDNIVDEPIVSNETFTVNGVSFTMIGVEGGTFTMGATSEQGSDAESNEMPAHQVTLSSYAIGETEVTQELWKAVMGSNPSYYGGEQNPVDGVSWNDCQEFISKLNDMTGENFRLPTEAEWEYAARGGKESNGYKYSGSNTIGDVAWYDDNSSSQTHPVKTKQPNELGIYDMSGNVWEWCADWYSGYSSSAQIDPTGPSSGSYRMLRGGSWFNSAWYCRVTRRTSSYPSYGGDFGLRLVRQFIP